jgi:intracellular sulfur oxidation DsrE/DsrF family protein
MGAIATGGTMKTAYTVLLALCALLASGIPAFAEEPDKVVYHVSEGDEQATRALRNIRNHLQVDPTAKIIVVTHAAGVDFLLDGAMDKNGNPYNIPVEELAAKGVEFRVCNITLTRDKIDPKRLLPEAKIVPSGVREVVRLQNREGFAYLKP